MTATTPSARMLLDYAADEGIVTVANVAAYFSIEPLIAAEYVSRVGLVSPDDDGTYEIPVEHNGDPDDALDAFLDRVGVDHADTPLDQVPSRLDATPPADSETSTPPARTLADEVAELRDEVATLRGMVETLMKTKAPKKSKSKRSPVRRMADTIPKRPAHGKRLTVPAMIESGVIAVGDEVEVRGERARLAEKRCVTLADGTEIKLAAWGKQVTGWPSFNVYLNVKHVLTGKTLDRLRVEATA